MRPLWFLLPLLVMGVENNESTLLSETAIKLKELRSLMVQHNISAYIIPTADDHQSEYVAPADRRREYISGFTGSVGTAVVTDDKAVLWADTRYHIQAAKQINPEFWTLIKQGNKNVATIQEWLVEHFKDKNSTRIGADPRKVTITEWEEWVSHLGKKGIELVSIIPNLVDEIWKDRPSYSSEAVYVYPLQFAGERWEEKVAKVRKKLEGWEADTLVVSALDEVAWLLNLRGSDVPFTPVFRAFVILTLTSLRLYIPQEKVTEEVQQHLTSNTSAIEILPYEDFWSSLKSLTTQSKLIILPTLKHSCTSFRIKDLVSEGAVDNKTSPIMEMKSYKNEVEAEGMRRAHIKDSVALCQLIYNMTLQIADGVPWDEMKVVDELNRLRSEQEYNKGASFKTIAAFGVNSAMPHYSVTKETNLRIDETAPLTIDSGGQYLDGTIDTTRVLHFGNPRQAEIDSYTALLKGVIDLATTVFPEGTKMEKLDFIVRRPLYQTGRDFGHGTTHGTGVFLSVHEAFNGTYYENFVGSQEPGYYRENDFGLRLENLVIVRPAKVENLTNDKLLTFEPLTLVPYERKLISVSQMEKNQIVWLNSYHKKVRDLVGPEMIKQGKHELHKWLLNQTEPVV